MYEEYLNKIYEEGNSEEKINDEYNIVFKYVLNDAWHKPIKSVFITNDKDKNVFLNDTYLINLASYWGCRLDSITDMRMEHTSGPNTSDSSDYYIAVDHDGKTSRVYLTSTYQKKVYKILYKEWQQTIATMK